MSEIEVAAIYNPEKKVTEKTRSKSLINSTKIQHAHSITSNENNVHLDEVSDVNIPHQHQQPQDHISKKSGHQHKFSTNTKKIYCGVFVTVGMTTAWVAMNHFIKSVHFKPHSLAGNSTDVTFRQNIKAPFFTTWFCTNWLILFFPLFLLKNLCTKCQLPNRIIKNTLNSLNERGYNFGYFLLHCSLFCLLWVSSMYLYVHSLNVLLATDAIALYATNMCSLYLLSWVILHEQFVGIRIVAVIICDTGIALLVYMDGITKSPTLIAVLLAALAAAGFATFKVLFKKVLGDVNYDQLSLILSSMGLINGLCLWPVIALFYFAHFETFDSYNVPWVTLSVSSLLFLVTHLFQNFGVAITYELFVNLALITSVPISGAWDILLHSSDFAGMKLVGIILISIGYFLVLFPENWPDYIIRLIRNIIRFTHNARHKRNRNVINIDAVDYRTGYIKSHLRSPSGRVR